MVASPQLFTEMLRLETFYSMKIYALKYVILDCQGSFQMKVTPMYQQLLQAPQDTLTLSMYSSHISYHFKFNIQQLNQLNNTF